MLESSREEAILAFWERERVFERSVEERRGRKLFSFYDGPPFATGLPHYGHILAGTLKDVVLRYKTMQGFYVPRRFGWDCHGLPVETEIVKANDLAGAAEIEAFGIAKFNEACRGIVQRYTKEWEHTVKRMGRWVDFSQTYRTMDASFMESVWWVFGELYKKGLVYEGFKVMPYSAALGTPLSNFEANLNYKDVDDPSLTVMFPLVDEPGVSLLAWTTTPWTLPSNLAVAVGEDLEYVKVKEIKSGHRYILARERLPFYFKNPEEFEIVATMKGRDLAGKRYVPLFSYFVKQAQPKAFHVLVGDFVSTEDGTGIVHCAPAFGEADFFVCAKEEIEPVCPVDQNGKFTDEVPEYAGLFVKDADKEIIKRLKSEGKIFHHGQVRHRYPFCWRSDTPLIYKAVRTWFVAVEKVKDKCVEVNKEITWVPEHIKEGRFGKWLEQARDWAISRNRYWGTPIPIWRSPSGEIRVIASIEELKKKTGAEVSDIHRHFIDHLTFVENGEVFTRVPEVFDCWFESGSMPYAQNHFPFENKEETLQGFPADFIAEGQDQTRCWFYTLTVISAALFGKPAFKNVIVNGIILAEDGNKMSKRLKNYPEPEIVFQRYGADAVRLYLLGSPASAAEDLRFSERGVELVLRQVLIPLWNAAHFLASYAKIYDWNPEASDFDPPESDLDRWILSRAQSLVATATDAMDRYVLQDAVLPLEQFVDQLTNWYIRRSRPRFWSEVDSKDRRQAFETLHTVLLTFVKVAAPFAPFIAEEIYGQLGKAPVSVHLCDFPKVNGKLRDEKLEREMAGVQAVVSLGHALRKTHKLKVRQPLPAAHVACGNGALLQSLKHQKQLIADELNVKEMEFHADESEFVAITAKPNFRILGKKVGPLMAQVQAAFPSLTQKDLKALHSGKEVPLQVGGETVLLTAEDVQLERKALEHVVALTEGEITVALNTTLTEELLVEGLARELVNKLNTMRRDGGFAITDRIAVTIQTTERMKHAFNLHRDFICHEVLAEKVTFATCEGEVWDLNGEATTLSIEKQ
jgi:isoleucyl-tRNA synthetase